MLKSKKYGIIAPLLIVIFILSLEIAHAKTITDAFSDGLIKINDFFEAKQYETYSTAIDFFLFSILFVSLYMAGAKNVFREIKRPEKVVVILLGLVTAFLLVLAEFSITLLLPYAHWILFLLLFLLLLWLFKGIEQKPWRVLLALALALLPFALLQGYCDINWLLYLIIFAVLLFLLKGIKNRFGRFFAALIITLIIFLLLQFACGFFGLPDISGISGAGEEAAAKGKGMAVGAAAGFRNYAGGLWENMKAINFNYAPGVPDWLRSKPKEAAPDNRLRVVHPVPAGEQAAQPATTGVRASEEEPEAVPEGKQLAPSEEEKRQEAAREAKKQEEAKKAEEEKAKRAIEPIRVEVDLVRSLDAEYEFKNGKWHEDEWIGSKEIDQPIYQYIYEKHKDSLGSGVKITHSDNSVRNVPVDDFRRVLVANSYAEDAARAAEAKDRNRAMEFTAKADQVRPKDGPTSFSLGLTNERIGRPIAAELLYQRALNQDPNNGVYRQRLDNVKRIQSDRLAFDFSDWTYKERSQVITPSPPSAPPVATPTPPVTPPVPGAQFQIFRPNTLRAKELKLGDIVIINGRRIKQITDSDIRRTITYEDGNVDRNINPESFFPGIIRGANVDPNTRRSNYVTIGTNSYRVRDSDGDGKYNLERYSFLSNDVILNPYTDTQLQNDLKAQGSKPISKTINLEDVKVSTAGISEDIQDNPGKALLIVLSIILAIKYRKKLFGFFRRKKVKPEIYYGEEAEIERLTSFIEASNNAMAEMSHHLKGRNWHLQDATKHKAYLEALTKTKEGIDLPMILYPAGQEELHKEHKAVSNILTEQIKIFGALNKLKEVELQLLSFLREISKKRPK